MHHDAKSNAGSQPITLERHRASGDDVARTVLFRRLRRAARDNPAAVLGVLAYWLGPQEASDAVAPRS